jgi:hypothetical protein
MYQNMMMKKELGKIDEYKVIAWFKCILYIRVYTVYICVFICLLICVSVYAYIYLN